MGWGVSEGRGVKARGNVESGSVAKCRSVLCLRRGVVAVAIGVRAHFGVACRRTACGRIDSGQASVETLKRCHRRTSLARTGSGLDGNTTGCG